MKTLFYLWLLTFYTIRPSLFLNIFMPLCICGSLLLKQPASNLYFYQIIFVFSSFLTSCHWSTRNALKLLENITSEIVTLISCMVLTNLCSHQYTEKWKAHLGIWSSEHGSLFLTVLLIICVCPGVGAQGWSWDRSLCARSSTAFSPATH